MDNNGFNNGSGFPNNNCDNRDGSHYERVPRDGCPGGSAPGNIYPTYGYPYDGFRNDNEFNHTERPNDNTGRFLHPKPFVPPVPIDCNEPQCGCQACNCTTNGCNCQNNGCGNYGNCQNNPSQNCGTNTCRQCGQSARITNCGQTTCSQCGMNFAFNNDSRRGFDKYQPTKIVTAQELITRAWYLSGIVARNLQVPTGDQISDGLYLLNALLDFKQIETDLIPYWTYIELNAIPRQEFYFLPYVAAIQSLTFNLGTVRYPMNNVSSTNYYGSSRVDNISTLPFSWNYNRALGGGNLGLYFKPDRSYPLKMMVKLFLVDVQLTTNLADITECVPYRFINNANQGYDSSYIEYLRYALARFMCSEYGVLFNPQSEKIFQSYQRKLMYIEPPDLSVKKTTILAASEQVGYSWGDVNIGRGWRPS